MAHSPSSIAAPGNGNITIRSKVNPDKTTIGVPVQYSVTIAGENLSAINITLPEKREYFPDVDKKSLSTQNKENQVDEDPAKKIPLYIIQNARKEDSSDQGMSMVTIILDMVYYRTGKYTLPALGLSDNAGIQIGYRIPEVTIEELNKEGQLQDIEPPLELSGNYYRFFILLGGLILICALCFFAFKFIQKRRMKQDSAPIPVPPIDMFMREVFGLKRKNLIDSGDIEIFVVEISQIFRRFISDQFGCDALEMTRTEIINIIKKKLSRLVFEKYRDDSMKVLDLWDLTKFAEFTPSSELLLANLDLTITLAKRLASEVTGITATNEISKLETAR